ncbi:MAG: site-specific integrase [Oscillospiraceae bacterium]|nr:site-specific integrase [Oscillospiraceae bacterium]
MARKAAAGTGTIRKKTITRNGKEYTYWEARYTTGRDPGTGKQIQRSITGKTQKEVAQKLKAATAAIDAGTYSAPSRMTVGQWLDIWTAEYLGAVKPRTVDLYKSVIRSRIKPGLGAVKLESLTPHTVQSYYNGLSKEGLAPKTVKNIHGILHKALQQAVSNGYIKTNPADSCILPRAIRKELKPLDEDMITAFLKAIQGHQFGDLFTVTLFTGMREGEALGLLWDCVDLTKGTITVDKQLQLIRGSGGQYQMVPTKNSKCRSITLAASVVKVLRDVKRKQLENRLRYGPLWEDSGFVFTDELGHHLSASSVYKSFKKVMEQIGSPETRFHDLRHSYAVASIRSGNDIKTVQENLGHATAAFTLDVYGHVTEKMKQESAAQLDQFIKAVNG